MPLPGPLGWNPFTAVAALIVGLKAEKHLWQEVRKWLSLIFSMIFSGLVAFLFVTGGMLLSGQNILESLGGGFVAVGTSLLALFLKSPLTRGLMISIPQEAVRELHEKGNQATIDRR